jgi:hypothetical protein
MGVGFPWAFYLLVDSMFGGGWQWWGYGFEFIGIAHRWGKFGQDMDNALFFNGLGTCGRPHPVMLT